MRAIRSALVNRPEALRHQDVRLPEAVRVRDHPDDLIAQATIEAERMRIEQGRQAGNGFRCRCARSKQRHACAIGLGDGFRRGRCGTRHEQAGQVVTEDPAQGGCAAVRRQRLEVPHLARAKHEHAARAQVGIETREGEAGFLRVRDCDAAFDASRARQQLEIQHLGLGDIAENRGDGDTARLGGFGHCGKPP